MNSIFNDQILEKIKTVRKLFLWAGVFILIGEVVLGAMAILTQDYNPYVAKIAATLALCAVVFFVGVDNFSRMIKDGRIVQSFALVSLIANIIWLVLAIMFIWEMIPFLDSKYYLSPLTKIMFASVNVATMCFLISIVWSIKETVAPVRPLKITATVCELYCGIYGAVVTFGGVMYAADLRWYALAGLMGLGFILTACAAAIVSNSGKKNNEEKGTGQIGDVSNDAAVQAKIQEMVEKEVQARMSAQQQGVAKTEPQTSTGSDSTTFGDITSGHGASSDSSN